MVNNSTIERRHVRDLVVANVIVIIFVGMEASSLLFFFLLSLSALVGFVVLPRRSFLIVPLLFLCIPLEISKSWIPIMETTYSREGNVSVLDFSRLAIAIVFIVWVISNFRQRKMEISTNVMVISLFVFILYSVTKKMTEFYHLNHQLIEYLIHYKLALLELNYYPDLRH